MVWATRRVVHAFKAGRETSLPSSEPSSEAHLYVSLARNRAVEVSDGESLARAEGGRRHVARAPVPEAARSAALIY